MENIEVFNELEKDESGLTKSAIIYRNSSASFIYVCFHCGRMFNEINETLHHIETHFQLVNVMIKRVDQFTVKCNEVNDNLAMSPAHESFDIKTEFPDDFDDTTPALATVPIIEAIVVGEEYERRPRLRKQKNDTEEKQKKIEKSPAAKSNPKKDSIENPFRCHICSKVYKNSSLLRNHLNGHRIAELSHINRCKECDEYFKTAATLRSHVLNMHLQSQTTEGKYRKCDFIRYEERESFTEEQHQCEFCAQKFYIKSNLDMHLKTIHHSGQRLLQCSTCYSVFTAPKNYYAHQIEHKRVGSNVSEFDEKASLASIEALIDERVSHEEGEPFRCAVCGHTAEVHHDIRAHIRKKHVYPMFPPPMEQKKEFICDFCGAQLKSKNALLKHFLIHTNTKPHPCRFCGKFFRIASTTRIHERQHTGEKPYQCHECGKAFISKGLLTAHKKTHENRTYPCHICGKEFRLPSGYRNHIKTHRLERDFQCEVCEKTFNTRLYLKRHMEIHSERKHKCHYCDSTFNTGDGRRQHQRHRHKYEMSLPM